MDINILRSLVTLLSLLAFLGIVFWAYSRKRSDSFSQAERLPFVDTPNESELPESRRE